MKALLILPFIIAANWMPVSGIQSGKMEGYSLQSDCVAQKAEQCIDVGEEPAVVEEGFVSLEDVFEDDLSSPIWEAKSEVEACEGEEDCRLKLVSKFCEQEKKSFISEDFTEVYCTQIVGYNQKVGSKKLVINTAGWNQLKQERAQKAQAQAIKNQVKSLRECLAGVIDTLVIRNASKGLTKPQVKQMVQAYQPIMALLQSASGATARDEILAVNADGLLVTEADKTALVLEIDKCLGQ